MDHPRIAALFSWAPLWVCIGAANLLLGMRVALSPDGSHDLNALSFWAYESLVNGRNPYVSPLQADYPPWALVTIAPLLLIPPGLLPLVWACTGVVLAIAVVWLGLKAMAVEAPPMALAVGSFLAWSAVRSDLGQGQFTLLAVAAGLGAICLTRRGSSSWLSGLLLAVALMKPHVGVAFVAWALFEGRFRLLVTAAGVIVLATLGFSARVHQTPPTVVMAFAHVLGRRLLGSTADRGSVELRPLLQDIFGASWLADAVTLGFVVLTFVAIARTLGRLPKVDSTRASLPLACMWTLVSTLHQTYDLVLLWPVWIALWHAHRTEGNTTETPYVLAFVQSALVVGVPAVWWKLSGRGLSSTHGSAIGAAALHFDRLWVVALLVYFMVVLSRSVNVSDWCRSDAVTEHPRQPSIIEA